MRWLFYLFRCVKGYAVLVNYNKTASGSHTNRFLINALTQSTNFLVCEVICPFLLLRNSERHGRYRMNFILYFTSIFYLFIWSTKKNLAFTFASLLSGHVGLIDVIFSSLSTPSLFFPSLPCSSSFPWLSWRRTNLQPLRGALSINLCTLTMFLSKDIS